MDAEVDQVRTLLDLEARHDEVLRQLDDLDRRILQALEEIQPPRIVAPLPAAAEAERKAA